MNFKEYIIKYNIKLNQQQEKAVLSTNGAILLLAVPGSGKTTVIVSRIGYMIYCLDINPKNILTLTYSVAAAKDMKDRFCKIFGIKQIEELQFRTINSFCLSILKEYEKEKSSKVFCIIENPNEIISKIYYEITKEFANEIIVKDILTKVAYCKNMMISIEEIKKIDIEGICFYKIYSKYEEYKIKNKLMDFDDQLKYAYTILKTYPNILKKLQQIYKYINVDEAQDTSKIQHEIIELLVNKNIFMVGDEDQSIYKFRAAYPEALLEFDKRYKDAHILLMETNYRSTKSIVNISNDFIRQNKDRKDKSMISNMEKGNPVIHNCLKNVEKQYESVLKSVKKNNKKVAILYRNNNSAIPLIDILENSNIKFNIREQDTTFFRDKIVEDIKDFIEFSKNTNNFEIFKKIYFKINCGISKKIIEQIYIANNKKNIFDTILNINKLPLWQTKKIINVKREFKLLKNKNSYETLNSILNKIEYKNFLQSKIADSMSENMYNQKINVLYFIANKNKKKDKFLKKLEVLEKIIKKGSYEDSCNITLSTIHSSKGLEYDKVILIDVISGILPLVDIPKETKNKDYKEKLKQYEEEVRLFYVGMTRAKKELEIVSYKSGYENNIKESEFINQIFKTEVNKSK